MSNLNTVNNSDQISKVLEFANDKLVILMFYTKNNSECRKAKAALERNASNHNLSYFCIVDVDNFDGDKSIINNINKFPKFDCYYMNNSFGGFNYVNERDMVNNIRTAEQYVMTQNNMRIQSVHSQFNQQMMPTNQQIGLNAYSNLTPQLNQLNQINPMANNINPQINPLQIQQQILNNLTMQNPVLAQQLLQNPAQLQQMVQQAVQQAIQQQVVNQTIQQQSQPPPIQTQIQQQPDPIKQNLPTLQQMQQMFQIWQLMQKMGILNTQPEIKSASPTTPTAQLENGVITLPNGDKLYPLQNGQYGLVKKSN